MNVLWLWEVLDRLTFASKARRLGCTDRLTFASKARRLGCTYVCVEGAQTWLYAEGRALMLHLWHHLLPHLTGHLHRHLRVGAQVNDVMPFITSGIRQRLGERQRQDFYV